MQGKQCIKVECVELFHMLINQLNWEGKIYMRFGNVKIIRDVYLELQEDNLGQIIFKREKIMRIWRWLAQTIISQGLQQMETSVAAGGSK